MHGIASSSTAAAGLRISQSSQSRPSGAPVDLRGGPTTNGGGMSSALAAQVAAISSGGGGS